MHMIEERNSTSDKGGPLGYRCLSKFVWWGFPRIRKFDSRVAAIFYHKLSRKFLMRTHCGYLG